MEGNYPVFYQQQPVGKVQVRRVGLYYSFFCRCRRESGVVCRLIMKCGGGWENLGIPVPEGDGLELNRKLPARHLGEGEPEFLLIPHDQAYPAVPSEAKGEKAAQERSPSEPEGTEPAHVAQEALPQESELPPAEEHSEREPEEQPVEPEATEEAQAGETLDLENTEPKEAVPESAGEFYPVETDMPFSHLDELERGILIQRDGQTGVLIPKEAPGEDQISSSSPTGQWSEPMTSE